MATKEVEVKVRPVAYVIGLVFVAIWQAIGTFLTGFTQGQTLNPFATNPPIADAWFCGGFAAIVQYAFLMPFIVTVLSVLLRRVKALDLSGQELAVIYAMLWVTFLIPCYYGITPLYTVWAGALTDAIYGPFAKRILPGLTYFAPDPKNDAIWKAFWWSGPLDWAAWAPAILFNTAYFLILYLLFVMISTIFRRVFIDVEGLPFPWATAGAELINISTSESPEKPSLFRNKFIWAGLGLGLVSTANYWLPFITTVPWQPDLLGYDLTKLSILQWVPLTFTFDPWMIGAAFLIPREWLLSYVVWTFILYWIMPPMLNSAGIIGTMPIGIKGYTVYANMFWQGVPQWNTTYGRFTMHGPYGALFTGVMLSFALWPLFTVQREHLANSIRALWKKLPPGEEKDEPMPYKWIWTIFIVLLIAYAGIVHWSSQGVAPFWWAIINIGWLTFWTALPRMRMEGTLAMGGVFSMANNPARVIYRYWWFCSTDSPICPGEITGIEDPKTVLRALGTYHLFPAGHYAYVSSSVPYSTSLDAYKIGKLTNTHSKYIFSSMILGIVVATPLASVLFLNWCHMYGTLDRFAGVALKNWPVRASYNEALGAANGWWPWYGQNNGPGVFSYGFHVAEIIGLAAGIGLWILVVRLPWLPLHPIGIAGAALASPIGWLWPALVAFIIKTLVLRIGGVSLYERKGMPIAIGLVLAFSVTYLACGFLDAYKILAK